MADGIVIPVGAADLLREGLRSQIATAARQIIEAEGRLDTREHPERYEEPLRSIDAFRKAMDELGWSAVTPQSNPHLDLQIHGWALTMTLADEVSSHAAMLRDEDEDKTLRQAIAGNLNELTALALTVLLRVQAQILHPAKLPAPCSGEAYAGFL